MLESKDLIQCQASITVGTVAPCGWRLQQILTLLCITQTQSGEQELEWVGGQIFQKLHQIVMQLNSHQ